MQGKAALGMLALVAIVLMWLGVTGRVGDALGTIITPAEMVVSS